LLAAVTPMVVKLRLAALTETGSVVGRLSGIGTVGALAGTFGTGFLLVAAMPTSVILLALGGVLVAVGAVLTARLRGLRAAAGRSGIAIVGAAATLFAPQPCDVETAYHCARVVADATRPTGRTLQLDTLPHSYVDLANPEHLEFSYVRGIASVLDVVRPAGEPVRALHLGGGGLTIPRYLDATRNGTGSLVLEIDQGVVDLDVSRLGLRIGEGIDVRVQDARTGLAQQRDASRDVVIGDAFGGLSVPWHLTTRETIEDVRRVLAPDGVYAINVIDYPPLRFARAEVATLAEAFDHVALIARPPVLAGADGGNLVLVGSDQPLPLDAIRERLAERASELELRGDVVEVAAFAGDARVLTDDFAPVDQLLTPYGRR
jgi:spermidine synthase